MLVCDTETTGLDPKKHSIIEIAAVDFSDPTRRFYAECRPWDGAEISREALEVNGATKDELQKRGKSLKQVMDEFAAWLVLSPDRTFAGENPGFDRDFVQRSLDMFALNNGCNLPYRTVDMHSVAVAHMLQHGKKPPVWKGKTDLNSDKVFRYVGLPEEPKPHKAMNGALMETEAFYRLIYGTALLPEFASYPVKDLLNNGNGKPSPDGPSNGAQKKP